MKLKTERGRSTNKVKDLQSLCKHWWLASSSASSSGNNMQWDSVFIRQSVWAKTEEITSEKKDLYTWGQIIG
eukprot:2216151-Lingulodinium_polyedra.AAC.1